MKALLYCKYFVIFFFLQTSISNAQTTFSNEGAIEFIKDYYSKFKTGYDFDGKYVIVSNNYQATFSGSIFTLTFDTFDEKENIQQQKIIINLKDVISIEPYGGKTVKIHDSEPTIIPICLHVGFKTKDEVYEISIHSGNYEDVTATDIYKAFEAVWKSHQRKK